MSNWNDRIDAGNLHFVDVDGIRTRYYEAGTGEPIVLIHGSQFSELSSLDKWSRNVDALARRFHVYAIDKLGQGHTDNPKRDEDYTFDALYRHFDGCLQALGISGAHLVGHSRGGLLATWHALQQPHTVRSLVIVDSNSIAPDDPGAPHTTFYDDREKVVEGWDKESTEYLRAVLDSNSYSPDHVTDEFIESYRVMANLPKTKQAQARYPHLKHTVWLPSLQRFKAEALQRIDEVGLLVPTVIVWGADDPSAPLYLGHRLFDRIRAKTEQVSLHVINRAGHPVYREQPEAFNRLLLGLL